MMINWPPALPSSSRVNVQAQLPACSSIASRLTLNPALRWRITAPQGKHMQASGLAHRDATLQTVDVNVPLREHTAQGPILKRPPGTRELQWPKANIAKPGQ